MIWIKSTLIAVALVAVWGVGDGNGYRRGHEELLNEQHNRLESDNKQLSAALTESNAKLIDALHAVDEYAQQISGAAEQLRLNKEEVSNALNSNTTWATEHVPGAVANSLRTDADR